MVIPPSPQRFSTGSSTTPSSFASRAPATASAAMPICCRHQPHAVYDLGRSGATTAQQATQTASQPPYRYGVATSRTGNFQPALLRKFTSALTGLA
jgi:hypothetical protein